jgi:hypothetical protein
MAAVKETTETGSDEQTNGSSETNGGTGRTALRAAAIAAASGATAIAAKKAFSSRSDSDDEDKDESGSGKGPDSVLSTALTSGWDSARDSIVPMLGNAAVQAGEYVGRSAPELVRETIVPQFIRGFERARKSSDDD